MKNRCFLGQLPALVLCEIKEKGFVSPNAAEPRHDAFVVILSPHLREWDLLTMHNACWGSVETSNPFKFYLGTETL